MYLLAHVALATLAGLIVQRARPASAGRLHWWALGGILPDLVDKPLSLLVPLYAGHGRGLGHSALFVAVLLAVGLWSTSWRAIALGAASHLALDLPWKFAASFAWPLLGAPEAGPALGVDGYFAILVKPTVLAGEIVGACVLAAIAATSYVRRRSTSGAAAPLEHIAVVLSESDAPVNAGRADRPDPYSGTRV